MSRATNPQALSDSEQPPARAQVLHYLQGNRVRVLVIGDSLMRQLHGRLVHMFRGSGPPVVDYHVSGLVRYALCGAGDSLTVADGCASLTIPPSFTNPLAGAAAPFSATVYAALLLANC